MPLPTPDGPVYDAGSAQGAGAASGGRYETSSLRWRSRQPADRLARRDPALREDPIHLHAPVLRDGEQQVEDLGRLQVFRRIEQQPVDLLAAGLEVALELRAPRADLVGALQRVHALGQRTLGSRARRTDLVGDWAAGDMAARLYTRVAGRYRATDDFRAIQLDLNLRSSAGSGYLTLFAVFAGVFC